MALTAGAGPGPPAFSRLPSFGPSRGRKWALMDRGAKVVGDCFDGGGLGRGLVEGRVAPAGLLQHEGLPGVLSSGRDAAGAFVDEAGVVVPADVLRGVGAIHLPPDVAGVDRDVQLGLLEAGGDEPARDAGLGLAGPGLVADAAGGQEGADAAGSTAGTRAKSGQGAGDGVEGDQPAAEAVVEDPAELPVGQVAPRAVLDEGTGP